MNIVISVLNHKGLFTLFTSSEKPVTLFSPQLKLVFSTVLFTMSNFPEELLDKMAAVPICKNLSQASKNS